MRSPGRSLVALGVAAFAGLIQGCAGKPPLPPTDLTGSTTAVTQTDPASDGAAEPLPEGVVPLTLEQERELAKSARP